MSREREQGLLLKAREAPRKSLSGFIGTNSVKCPSGTNHREKMGMTLPLEHSGAGNEISFLIWAAQSRGVSLKEIGVLLGRKESGERDSNNEGCATAKQCSQFFYCSDSENPSMLLI